MSLGFRRTDPGLDRPAEARALAVPPAARATTPGWRDPRLWIGLLIVAVSVVGGARLLAAADDTVAVWAVADDAGPGAQLDAGDLVAHRVRFADEADLAAYFRVADRLPADLRLVRGVGAGELLPRAAVGSAATAAGTVELPVAVDVDQVPPAVHTGSVVDVYLLGSATGRTRGAGGDAGRPILERATVVDAPSVESGLGATGARRQLVLAVPEADAAAYFATVGGVADPALTVVRRG